MNGFIEAKWAVEGVLLSTSAVYSFAVKNGFEGPKSTIWNRLKHGATTWAEITANPKQANSEAGKKSAAIKNGKRATERKEMIALCAELDLRKAAIESAP